MKNNNKKNIIIIAVGLVIVFATYKYLQNADNTQTNQAQIPPTNVTVAEVTTQDMPNIINLVGNVYAYETVEVKSRIDSQITKAHFNDGDLVKEGQLLFELDDSLITAELRESEANLKRDEAQLQNAKTQYERYRKLAQKGFASGEKLEESQAAYQTQIAAVNATKASIESAETKLTFTKIIAPISGRAGTINVTRGNTVKANDTNSLVTINRVQPIRVQFAVPQRYYDDLRSASSGQKIEVQAVRSDGQSMAKGVLEYIDNNIDTKTGTFNARAIFENAEERLWPGMFVNVYITLNIDKNAMIIPQVAVQNSQEGSFVFVADVAHNKAIKRTVEILRMQDNKAILKSGLQLGEQVITDGIMRLTDGSTIEIKK